MLHNINANNSRRVVVLFFMRQDWFGLLFSVRMGLIPTAEFKTVYFHFSLY